MKIKDYKCKCGNDDFFFIEDENSMGIYCTSCGKWKKWANKDERNLFAKQAQKTGKWVRNDNGTYSCSVCQSWIPEEQHCYARYCLYCGAKMEGEQNESTAEA